jgi:hypothetical protein
VTYALSVTNTDSAACPAATFNMGNAAVNAFSMLSCHASGATLTLHINGCAKVSATDATFTTSAAGCSISAHKTSSHRVYNFIALVQ